MHCASNCEPGICGAQSALYRQALTPASTEAAEFLWHRKTKPADPPKYFKPPVRHLPGPICGRCVICNLVSCARWEQVLHIGPDAINEAISTPHETLTRSLPRIRSL